MRLLSVTILGAIACGGGGNTGDAPIDAATIDAEPPDAAPPPPSSVRVLVRQQDGQPAPGFDILFQRPDDTVITVQKTDANGIAQTLVSGSTNVSLLAPGANNTKVAYVYLDAKPGDVLEIGPGVTPEAKAVGAITLQLPPTTGSFNVVQRCRTDSGSGGQAPTLQLTPCGTPTNFLVVSNAGRFYTPLLALTDGQTVNLTSEVYRTTRSHMVQLTSAPQPQFGGASIRVSAVDYALTVTPVDSRNVTVSGGNALATYTVNDVPNVPVTTEVTVAPVQGIITWMRRLAPGDQIFDWDQVGVPYVSAMTYASGTLSWTEQGTGGDYAYGNITIQNGGVTRMNLAIAGPRTSTSLRVPVYPATHAAFNPQSGDTTSSLSGYVARSTGGWDRARPYIHRFDFQAFLDWLGTGELVWSR